MIQFTLLSATTIPPAEVLVEELAGSIPLKNRWKGQDIDKIIERAKDEHFQEKYKSANH